MDPKQKKTIFISTKWYNVILKRIKNSNNEFNSVDEYIEFILSEILTENETQPYSQEEKEEIEKNLKKMGYL